MNQRILFLVNGLGLGNSTRIHGIIQHIDKNYAIDVFGCGNSFKYFKQVRRVQNIYKGFSMEYGLKNGRIDFLSTLRKTQKNLQSFYKNRRLVKNILKSCHYSLIVSDSDFSPLFIRKRPKWISVNNADVIIKKALKTSKNGCWMQFFTELGDFLFNLSAPDKTLSPFFQPCRDTKKIKHIPVIVRKEFQRSKAGFHRRRVLVMTGGASHFNSDVSIEHKRDDYDISVLGDEIKVSGRAEKEDKTFNASDLMNLADIVVVNGGFSSISEALALAKPMIVIPLKGHIEQKINALYVRENSLGIVSVWENLEDSILHVKENYDYFKKNLLNYTELDGAAQAACLILKESENDTVRG